MKQTTPKYHGFTSSVGCDYKVTNIFTEFSLYFMRRWEAEAYIISLVQNDIWDMDDFTLSEFDAAEWRWNEIKHSMMEED